MFQARSEVHDRDPVAPQAFVVSPAVLVTAEPKNPAFSTAVQYEIAMCVPKADDFQNVWQRENEYITNVEKIIDPDEQEKYTVMGIVQTAQAHAGKVSAIVRGGTMTTYNTSNETIHANALVKVRFPTANDTQMPVYAWSGSSTGVTKKHMITETCDANDVYAEMSRGMLLGRALATSLPGQHLDLLVRV